jgi:hypothetical protein
MPGQRAQGGGQVRVEDEWWEPAEREKEIGNEEVWKKRKEEGRWEEEKE